MPLNRTMRIAEVAFPVPVHNTYHYRVPDDCPSLAAGTRVRATFGPRLLTGTVLSVFEGEPGRTLKSLASVVDAAPVLSAEMLECARWMSRRYGAAIGECVRCLLPPFIRPPVTEPGDPRSGSASPGLRPGRIGEEEPVRSRKWSETAFAAPQAPEPSFELTEGQRESVTALLERMRARQHEVAVLFGVPASGKTEVYLRLLREAVQDGGQALFMLPEISLTARSSRSSAPGSACRACCGTPGSGAGGEGSHGAAWSRGASRWWWARAPRRSCRSGT